MELSKSTVLLVKPISWSYVKEEITSKSVPYSTLEMFGQTSDGRSIYIRIPRKSTFIIKFAHTVDADMIENVRDIFNPVSVKTSNIDSHIMVIRAPESSPVGLLHNSYCENVGSWFTNCDVKQDPYGELESFWESREIAPYEYLAIEKYIPLSGKYTLADLNIRTEEEHVTNASKFDLSLVIPPNLNTEPCLLFWDIEVYSTLPGQFPESTNHDDIIFMISMIISNKDGIQSYVIVKGLINHNLIDNKDTRIVSVETEKELINKFLAIYAAFKPDYQIYYNGDMFDMPYLLDRMSLNNIVIPNLSKVISVTPSVINKGYITPFGMKYARTLNIRGTETIDLIKYYQLWYCHLPNYRLNTVAKLFLKHGKVNITINDMMESVTSKNPDKLAAIVDYSIVDSKLLTQLWNINNIHFHIESVCNNLGISIDTLLHGEIESVIDKAVYNIDAGTCLVKYSYITATHLKETVKGIYRNVYIYDYSDLYRQIMISSGQEIAEALGIRLEGAPPKLIMKAFYSPYINQTNLLSMLIKILSEAIDPKLVIAIEPCIIRTLIPVNMTWCQLLDKSLCYAVISKASSLIIDQDTKLETAGLSKLARPAFELATDVIHEYLKNVYHNITEEFTIPDLKSRPLEKFILTEKITNIENLKPNSVKYKLYLQYGSHILTAVTVKYVMTLNGPVLLSLLLSQDSIHFDYYLTEINKYLKDLKLLKVF